MMHRLYMIGYLGVQRAYLDIPLAEAESRYAASEGREPDIGLISTFEFTDEFGVYSAWPLNGKRYISTADRMPHSLFIAEMAKTDQISTNQFSLSHARTLTEFADLIAGNGGVTSFFQRFKRHKGV